jgi:hypothetical protein
MFFHDQVGWHPQLPLFLQYLETSCDGKIPFRLFLNTADGCCCIAQCVVVVVVTLAAGRVAIV